MLERAAGRLSRAVGSTFARRSNRISALRCSASSCGAARASWLRPAAASRGRTPWPCPMSRASCSRSRLCAVGFTPQAMLRGGMCFKAPSRRLFAEGHGGYAALHGRDRPSSTPAEAFSPPSGRHGRLYTRLFARQRAAKVDEGLFVPREARIAC